MTHWITRPEWKKLHIHTQNKQKKVDNFWINRQKPSSKPTRVAYSYPHSSNGPHPLYSKVGTNLNRPLHRLRPSLLSQTPLHFFFFLFLHSTLFSLSLSLYIYIIYIFWKNRFSESKRFSVSFFRSDPADSIPDFFCFLGLFLLLLCFFLVRAIILKLFPFDFQFYLRSFNFLFFIFKYLYKISKVINYLIILWNFRGEKVCEVFIFIFIF